ncbi:aldo/keto reductase [Staphylothermus hellenicus]|uniref:Aldo/keto reductase n=1 Tax=Staphylothermus hellenicus (strain DSM 12710 / JCM 10830 / BK20S6-10-b1 / P8) TaxID=591019 RepID=D7DA36_STAHD|nr:aldo/keto reductase [Staphylothermus hellenicus]ADI32632.1 aldo/keto reductase [Staphylothermus hellenicus DSM 12710]
MEYVEIRNTGIKISRIGLGTWQFSEAWGVTNYEDAKKIVGKALEMGINFFDTAMVYGNGMSEEFLGRALRELGVKREEVFIATKIPGDFLAPEDVFRSVDKSLKRLGTEYIDLLQLHWPPCWHNHPTCPYMRALEKLVDLGKVRFLGVSNYPVKLLEEVRSCLSKIDIVSMQYRYNLIERQAEIELIPYAEKNNMVFIPWSPLSKGALTGKYSLDNLPEFQDVRHRDPVFHPENFKKIQPLIDALKQLSQKYNKTPAQISLNWMIMYSKNIVPIPGAKKPEHVVDNANSVGWRLSYEDWRLLDEISKGIRISYAAWYLY